MNYEVIPLGSYIKPVIWYEGKSGSRIQLTSYPYRMLSSTNLFDYSYEYETSVQGRAKNLKPKLTPKSITIVILGTSDLEVANNKNALLEAIDADSYNSQGGTLYCGDYGLEGVFVQSNKPSKYVNVPLTTVSLSFYPNSGSWKKMSTHHYDKTVATSPDLDYPFDYTYDFRADNVISEIENTSYLPSNFILTIIGPAINPIITIGQNNYGFDGVLHDWERLIINSAEGTMIVQLDNGATENVFSQRFKDFPPFEPIPAGTNIVAWNGLFEFVLDLFDERREPNWVNLREPEPEPNIDPIDPPMT